MFSPRAQSPLDCEKGGSQKGNTGKAADRAESEWERGKVFYSPMFKLTPLAGNGH